MKALLITFLVSVLITAICSAQPTLGLVAYYPFNGNANDESGNNLHGTPYGASPTLDRYGHADQAYQFDGTEAYIEVANHDSLDIGDGEDLTVCLWMYTTYTGQWAAISKYSYGAPGGFVISSDSGRVFMEGRDSEGVYRNSGWSSTFIADGEWHFVAGMRSGSTWSIWVDGSLENSTDVGNASTMGNSCPMFIGCGNDGNNCSAPVHHFLGILDDIRIYNRSLIEGEIRDLFGDLVAFYPFNGSADDASGNGNHGTLYGCTQGNDRFGETGHSYDFNGTSDYIMGSGLNPLQGVSSTGFSFSVWINLATLVSDYQDVFEAMIQATDGEAVDGLELFLHGTEGVGFAIAETRQIGHVVNSSLPASGQWTHVAGTYDGHIQRLFMNGVAVDSVSWDGSITLLSGLSIGRDYESDIQYFNGSIDDARIYRRALTAEEVFALYDISTGVNDRASLVPRSTLLSSCYPNPFNPSTTIRFSLPYSGVVELEVFNLLGQSVSRAILGRLGIGEHAYQIDASSWASGTYLYQLSVNNLSSTGKLKLIR